jgi:DNA polymerase-3 subunit alpha
MSCPTNKPVVPLHCHTQYSVLDGVSSISQYIDWCKKTGSPALGISDHGWAIGLSELYHKCKAAGLTALPGVEFYVAPDSDYKFKKKPYAYFHLTVHAFNEIGYRNIIKLASISWNQDTVPGYRQEKGVYVPTDVSRVVKRFGSEKPRITFGELMSHHEGLVISSGCLIGVAAKGILEGERDEAERNIQKLLSVFKGRFFAELLPHSVDHDYDRATKQFKKNECNDFATDGDLQKPVNLAILELARKYDLPPIMSLDSHFVDQTEKQVQDVILSNGDPDGWKFYNSYHLQTTEQIWEFWKDRYGSDEANRKLFSEAVENTHRFAEMAKDLTINTKYHQPTPEIPADIVQVSESPAEQRKMFLMRKIEQHGRMKWDDPEYCARLKREMEVICDNGVVDFSDYFLFLEKWCSWARAHSVLMGTARGSAGGALLAYLLKITHIDPVALKLPFERFLSEGRIKRGKFPDIDCDFDSRDIVIAAMKQEYGDRYAQVSTHGTLKVKMAIKDASRIILGRNSNDKMIDAVTKTIPNTPQGVKDRDFLLGYKDKEGNAHPGHMDENPTLKRFFDNYPEVLKMVLLLLGIPRSVGRHASAVIISDEPISNIVPTCYVSGEPCTQYVASGENYVEKAGLIKFDILTVNNMKYAGDAIRLIQRERGYRVWEEKITIGSETFVVQKGELSIEEIPTGMKADPDTRLLNVYQLPELPAVFDDIKAGKTESLFQLHTPGMTDFCRRVAPNSILDISAVVALDRPGPLDAVLPEGDGKTTFAEAYIRRKARKMPVTYVHPDLAPILKDTYGVYVYQEQVARTFTDCAGFTAEEADYWREMLAKKKKQDVEKFIPQLRERLLSRGWTPEQAQVFVNACLAASQYSFNMSHSYGYAYNAYITAFLKKCFPTEWWTAVLRNAKVEDIKEKRFDVAVRDILVLPHVNGPATSFELKDGKIHAPLYLLDGVGDKATSAIQRERERMANDLALSGEDPNAVEALSSYASFMEFYERCKDRSINSRVIKQLILCGAFSLVEKAEPRSLLARYYYLNRVSGLKAGRGKKGEELLEAALTYQKEHPEEAAKEFPEINLSNLGLELLRISALPIYRSDVHTVCKDKLEKFFIYGPDSIYRPEGGMKVPVLRDSAEVRTHVKSGGRERQYAIWCGYLSDTKTFSYTDKKTGESVTAFKMNVVNNGDSIECVMWPNVYQELGAPIENGLVVVLGNFKESREPGKYSLFVNDYQELRDV